LPFVFANRALGRRLSCFRKLRSALNADEVLHDAMTLPHRALAV